MMTDEITPPPTNLSGRAGPVRSAVTGLMVARLRRRHRRVCGADGDADARLSRDEFGSWIANNMDVATYLDRFTAHTDVRIASTRYRMALHRALDKFDAIAIVSAITLDRIRHYS